MNRIVVLVSIIIGIVGAYFLFNSSEEVKNPLNDTSYHQSNSLPKKIKKDSSQQIHSKTNLNNEDIKAKRNEKLTKVNEDSQKVEKFIEEKNLILVSSKDKDIKIYAKNPPTQDDFAPPMPPVFIKVKFKNKEDVISLNSDLIKANKKIYVINKSEIKEINTKDISNYAPPRIGQN